MKILDYIFAARPFLHLPVWSIFLVATYYHHQLSGKSFGLIEFIILFSLTLSAAAAYFINQIYDFESDKLNDKLGFLQKKILTDRNMITANIITSLLSVILIALISNLIFFILLQLLVLGYIYSAPPLRLKDRPFWGLLSNSYGFGFLIPLSVMPELNTHNSALLGWDNPFYFLATVASIYLLTTIPDIDGDRKTGKKTLSVIIPVPIVKILSLMIMLYSAYIAYRSNFDVLAIISVLSSIPIVLSLFIKNQAVVLFSVKFPILLLTLLAGYFYPYYFGFIVALIIITRVYYKKRFNMVYPKIT